MTSEVKLVAPTTVSSEILMSDTLGYLWDKVPALAHMMMQNRMSPFSCWQFTHGYVNKHNEPEVRAQIRTLTPIADRPQVKPLELPYVWRYVQETKVDCDTDLIIVSQWGTRVIVFVVYPPAFARGAQVSTDDAASVTDESSDRKGDATESSAASLTKPSDESGTDSKDDDEEARRQKRKNKKPQDPQTHTTKRVRLDDVKFYGPGGEWDRFRKQFRPGKTSKNKRGETEVQVFARAMMPYCRQINQAYAIYWPFSTPEKLQFTFCFRRATFQRQSDGPDYSAHVFQMHILSQLYRVCELWTDPCELAPLLKEPATAVSAASSTTAKPFVLDEAASAATDAAATSDSTRTIPDKKDAPEKPRDPTKPVPGEDYLFVMKVYPTYQTRPADDDDDDADDGGKGDGKQGGTDTAGRDHKGGTSKPTVTSAGTTVRRCKIDLSDFMHCFTTAVGITTIHPLFGKANVHKFQEMMKQPESQVMTYLLEQSTRDGIVVGFVLARHVRVLEPVLEPTSGIMRVQEQLRCRIYRVFMSPFIYNTVPAAAWNHAVSVLEQHALDTGCTGIDIACYTSVEKDKPQPLTNELCRCLFNWANADRVREKKLQHLSVRIRPNLA